MTTTNTTTAPLSTVIGVFPNHKQADRAIDELRHTDFSYERIRVVERGTGGFGDTLKGMFTGQASMASNTADSLVKMGMPEYEAQHYQHELDSNHVLVLMNADDRPEEAFSIMRQNGAFDINSRLRMATEDAPAETLDANTSRTAYNSQVPPTAPAPNGSQPVYNSGPATAQATHDTEDSQAAYDPATSQQSQAAYDPATPPTTYTSDVPPTPSDPGAVTEPNGREVPRNA